MRLLKVPKTKVERVWKLRLGQFSKQKAKRTLFFEVCGAAVLLVERDHVTPKRCFDFASDQLGSRGLSRPVKRLPHKPQKSVRLAKRVA